MDGVRTFLESSTIHGLAYISTTRKLVKLFWIVIVIAGFTGAGIMIYQSFQSWEESPVKTTIQTLPIRDITFPMVTVCPPKNTYTNLNYDMIAMKNVSLDNQTRDYLTNFAVEQLESAMIETLHADVQRLTDDDRYFNWYSGYSQFRLPTSEVYTSAPSGNIFTPLYGQKFDADMIDTEILYKIRLSVPLSIGKIQDIYYGSACQKRRDLDFFEPIYYNLLILKLHHAGLNQSFF